MIKEFIYNDSPVTFVTGVGRSCMVNATEMAKPFGKRPNDYLSLPSTNELISAVIRKFHISEDQIVITIQGSPQFGGGTWLHEDIILDFAQWLSIDLYLWVLDRIKESFFTNSRHINSDINMNKKAVSMNDLNYILN